MKNRKRVALSLSSLATQILDEIAEERGMTRSLVIEQYLRKTQKRRQKQQKKEIENV
jgi:predicted transcriptional regulator